MKVNVLPGDDRTIFECCQQLLFFRFVCNFGQVLCQAEVIPADNHIFDQTAGIGDDVLRLFIAFGEFLIVAEGDGFSEFLRLFDFTELFFD